MSSNAKAPLPSSLFDDDAPTTQRRRLSDTEEIELDIEVDARSRPFLDDLMEDEERPTHPGLHSPSA